MILGALALVVANAAAFLGAQALLEKIRSGKPSIDFVLFLLLRLLIVSAVVLVAGLLHLLTPIALGIAGIVVLAAFVALGRHRGFPPFRWPDAGRTWTVLIVVIALRLLLQVWFFAPYLGDSLGYHLPKVAEWVRAGGFTGELGLDPRSTFPAGFELIETWWVVFLHHDVLIEMAGVEMLLLAVSSVGAIADAMGWGTRTSVVAATLFALNPASSFQATSCMNDGAVTGLILAAAALLLGGVDWPILLLPIAMGAGVKPTFVYALPGLAILAALVPREESPGRSSPRTLALLALSALIVGSFWYLRNWSIYGNPIYPMGPGGMKTLASGTTLQRFGPSLRSLSENFLCFVDIRIRDHQLPPDAMCTGGFAWGPAGFALGSVALLPVLRAETLMRRLTLGLVVSAACIFTLVELDVWIDRFVVFLAAPPALALARLWDRYRFVAVLGALALCLQFVETMIPGNMSAESYAALRRLPWKERSAMPAPDDAPQERIAYACDDFGCAYPLYGPSYSRGLIYLREETTDQLLEHLDREAVTRIYVTPALPRRAAVFEEAVRRGRLRPFVRGPWHGYAVIPRP
jgi:hypothetical protein